MRYAKELRADGRKASLKKDRFTGGWLVIHRNPSKGNAASVLKRLERGIKAEFVALRRMGDGRKQLIIKTKTKGR